MSGDDSRSVPGPAGMEATDTRWSRIEEGDLTYVVQRFWRPIRRFLQTRLGSLEEAEDATQALFVKFIEKDLLATADRARGRFRSYLFTVVRRFMIDRLRSQNALAKGAGEDHVPLEGASAELTAEGLTPDEAFDRDWFFSLLNQARREVRSQLTVDGRETVYHAFHLYYFGELIHDARDGRRLHAAPDLPGTLATVSPCGRWLARFGADRHVHLYDLEAGGTNPLRSASAKK